jgi:membrane protease YdiL (CAAX protease family)
MKNEFANIGELRVHHGMRNRINKKVIISLFMRTILFALFGGIFVLYFFLEGHANPLQAAERWWPFQAIFANIVTFFVLQLFMKNEGLTYKSLFCTQPRPIKKNVFEVLWLVFVGFIIGGASLYIFSYLLLGSLIPPPIMFQELPVWAVCVAVMLFPLSNALAETPLYIGYALPRIHAATHNIWLAVWMAGLGLALQHITLPLVFDAPYMIWRFLAFVPLAIVLGVIFTKTKRLLPIVIAHGIMDLQLVLQLILLLQ